MPEPATRERIPLLRLPWPPLLLACCLGLAGCAARPPADTAVILIESSPTSLDPRIGIDAQAEHIDSLIFDGLVRKDERFNLQPWLAESWETPDPLTYIFHLRPGVRFHDGRPLTSQDVKWTLDSMRNGTVLTAKSGAFAHVARVDAPDPATVVIHLKTPDAALLWNLSDGAVGIVPAGSGRDFGLHPDGTGPFRFVSQQQDMDVVLERSADSWRPPAPIRRIRFAVVPDAITRALELEKGSADACVNCLTADMLAALALRKNLEIDSAPGTSLQYLSFNTQDRILADVRVRQAIASAIDRPLIIQSLWRGRARLAESLLPPNHWAWSPADPGESAAESAAGGFNLARANALLDEAGWKRGPDGVRFHLGFKSSTDESSRLLGLILQQQLRQAGIALEPRSFEFATFYADIVRGAFQMYTLRWIGGNEDPDIFRYAFDSSMFPPHGANRGRYSNPELDALIRDGGASSDQARRRADYARIQQILFRDLPSINLWYLDSVLVHNRRLRNVQVSASGTFDFLRTATLAP